MTLLTKLPAHVLREVAVAADADPRTVIKVVSGVAVTPLARKRILRALRLKGLAPLCEPAPGEGGDT